MALPIFHPKRKKSSLDRTIILHKFAKIHCCNQHYHDSCVRRDRWQKDYIDKNYGALNHNHLSVTHHVELSTYIITLDGIQYTRTIISNKTLFRKYLQRSLKILNICNDILTKCNEIIEQMISIEYKKIHCILLILFPSIEIFDFKMKLYKVFTKLVSNAVDILEYKSIRSMKLGRKSLNLSI